MAKIFITDGQFNCWRRVQKMVNLIISRKIVDQIYAIVTWGSYIDKHQVISLILRSYPLNQHKIMIKHTNRWHSTDIHLPQTIIAWFWKPSFSWKYNSELLFISLEKSFCIWFSFFHKSLRYKFLSRLIHQFARPISRGNELVSL